MTFTYLITGASRSLGLGYARALLAARPDARIVAAARSPDTAEGLAQLLKEYGKDKVHLLKLDVEDKAGVEAAVKKLESSGFLGKGGLDALINNAGVAAGGTSSPSQVTRDDILGNLNTNLFGVINVTSAFLPLLQKGEGKQIFGLSSICASIQDWGGNTSTTAYSISKVALNMYLKKLSVELEPAGFTVVMFHPGYVQTDMNKGHGQLTTKEATESATKNVFLAVSKKDNGAFVQWEGKPMPW
ncbi:hypothetical protein JCM6882_007428 [Rhodosporidiobolus microsporus]